MTHDHGIEGERHDAVHQHLDRVTAQNQIARALCASLLQPTPTLADRAQNRHRQGKQLLVRGEQLQETAQHVRDARHVQIHPDFVNQVYTSQKPPNATGTQQDAQTLR